MSERTPLEQASTATAPSLEERLAEVEERLEGLEYLLAHVLAERGIAPEAARAVAEERYGSTSIHQPTPGPT
jgi:hypothetical protein